LIILVLRTIFFALFNWQQDLAFFKERFLYEGYFEWIYISDKREPMPVGPDARINSHFLKNLIGSDLSFGGFLFILKGVSSGDYSILSALGFGPIIR